MKVQVDWGAQNTSATFTVKGADLEAACAFLDSREEWGRFEGHIQYKWKGDAAGTAVSVTLSPDFTLTMPTWPPYGDQKQPCKDAWDSMWRALRKHEDGHKDLFDQALAALVSGLEAMDAPAGTDVGAYVTKALKELRSNQAKYDIETDHGRSRGVELVIPEQCRAKRGKE